jgi:hypothetical protein
MVFKKNSMILKKDARGLRKKAPLHSPLKAKPSLI